MNSFTKTFADQLSNLTRSNEEKLITFQKSIDTNSKESRTELKENLESFKKELNEALKDYKDRLKEQFSEFEKSQQTQNEAISEKTKE